MAEDFFRDLGKSLTKVTRSAVTRTGTLVETTKLNTRISAEQKEIDRLYLQIGELVFRAREDGVSPDEAELENLTGEIRERRDVIWELKENLASAKGMKLCTKCRELMDAGAAFCPKCGEPAPAEEKNGSDADFTEVSEEE